MRIIRAKDYKDMSRKAANIISAQVILKPDSVLGLATGSSPIGTYEQLVKWYEKGDLDFADVTTVNLDEYYGMNKRFFASEDEVPRRAYSMGIHTIMTAKKVLVVASGEDKAWAIRESCFGPVTPKVPGSILQLHNDAIVIADEAALSLCGDFL